MSAMNIRQIEAFRAVVTMGSMSKAAALLGISQPAISRLISDFQDGVGFKLFTRRRYHTEPTADAKLLFEKVNKIFIGLDELKAEINDIRNAQSGKIDIAATSSYATGILPRLIAEYKADYPNTSIALHINSHDEVIGWIASGRADVGFVIQPVTHAAVTIDEFLSGPARCILPESLSLAAKKKLAPGDLANQSFVSFARGTPLRFEIDTLFNRLGVDRVLQVEATSHHAVCALVSAGLGVALVNPFAPIDGFGRPIESRPISPSVNMGLKLLVNPRTVSVSTERFREFFLGRVKQIKGKGLHGGTWCA